MTIKDKIFEYLWNDFKPKELEDWLYHQDSEEFEKAIGKESYLDIISEDYTQMSVIQIKNYIYNSLNFDHQKEWDKYAEDKYTPITGICLSNSSQDYTGDKIREWNLDVGRKYEILEIFKTSRSNDNHDYYIRYVDRANDLYPSGFIPKKLFDINLDSISSRYKVIYTDGKIEEILPVDWCEENYKPTIYSFWEDFYDDESKAVQTYFDTLDKLGIKEPWK